MNRRPHIAKSETPARDRLPFPGHRHADGRCSPQGGDRNSIKGGSRDPAGEVLAAFANVSRRIEDLARELKCLGYFDDDDDLPRAA